MDPQLSPGQIVFLGLVAAWLVFVLFGMLFSHLRKAQAHRERLAMIEKGLVPPAELYSPKYDAPPWAQHAVIHERRGFGPPPGVVARKLGILIIGAGAGIGWLLYLLPNGPGAESALAVGGFIAIIGLAFIVTSFNLGQPPTRFGHAAGTQGPAPGTGSASDPAHASGESHQPPPTPPAL